MALVNVVDGKLHQELGEKLRAFTDEIRPLGLEHHDVEVLHEELRGCLEQRGTIVPVSRVKDFQDAAKPKIFRQKPLDLVLEDDEQQLVGGGQQLTADVV